MHEVVVALSVLYNLWFVAQEILRLYPAAALIQRIAVHDAAIPLSDEGGIDSPI